MECGTRGNLIALVRHASLRSHTPRGFPPRRLPFPEDRESSRLTHALPHPATENCRGFLFSRSLDRPPRLFTIVSSLLRLVPVEIAISRRANKFPFLLILRGRTRFDGRRDHMIPEDQPGEGTTVKTYCLSYLLYYHIITRISCSVLYAMNSVKFYAVLWLHVKELTERGIGGASYLSEERNSRGPRSVVRILRIRSRNFRIESKFTIFTIPESCRRLQEKSRTKRRDEVRADVCRRFGARCRAIFSPCTVPYLPIITNGDRSRVDRVMAILVGGKLYGGFHRL